MNINLCITVRISVKINSFMQNNMLVKGIGRSKEFISEFRNKGVGWIMHHAKNIDLNNLENYYGHCRLGCQVVPYLAHPCQGQVHLRTGLFDELCS